MAPVGGTPRSVVADRLPSVVAIVVLGTFAALLLGFRSVFVAVKAMALNLLSVGAPSSLKNSLWIARGQEPHRGMTIAPTESGTRRDSVATPFEGGWRANWGTP